MPDGLPAAERKLQQGQGTTTEQIALGIQVGVVKGVFGLGNGTIDLANAVLAQPLKFGNFLATSIQNPNLAIYDAQNWGTDTGKALATGARIVLAADSYVESTSKAMWRGDFVKAPRDAINAAGNGYLQFEKLNPGQRSEFLSEQIVSLGLPLAAGKSTSVLVQMQEKMAAFIEKSNAVRESIGIRTIESAPAYATTAGERKQATDCALKMVGNGSASSKLTLADRLASVTGESSQNIEERLARFKANDAGGKKLLELSAIVQTCQSKTNFKPSLEALLSPSLSCEQLGAYRTLLEQLGPLNNLGQNYCSREVLSLRRTVEKNLCDFEKAAKSNDPKLICQASERLRDTSEALQIAREPMEAVGNSDKQPIRVMPLGIHEYTLEQVKEQFATNPIRDRIYEGLVKTLRELKENGCKRVYLNGSFTTGKWDPRDFDLTWEPHGVDVEGMDPVLTGPTWRSTRERKDKYLGDIFIRDRQLTGHDHVEQWQRDLRTGIKKGLITIDLEKAKL